jgi:predicted DNA-binding protein with PD1-like motif
MTARRFVRQPGPPARARVVVVPCRGTALRLALRKGERLLDAVAEGFARAGFESGVAELGALALGPFSYVMPAPARTPEHAAFYSQTFTPPGLTRLQSGALTFGQRDGAPFFHAHALWREADGAERGGHILPEATCLAQDAEIDAFGLDGARFVARHDAETNFKLFEPEPAPPNGLGHATCLAIRLRPNLPFPESLADVARAHAVTGWRSRGGVGSLIGARLAEGRSDALATEVYVEGVGETFGATVGLVDDRGDILRGKLLQMQNDVLMTFEICIVAA